MKSQILLSFLYFAVTFCHAQTIKFEHYNDDDGLSHNSVRHIAQDSKGFLWFGTFYGLNRFDGYQFKTFLSSESGKNSLRNDDITALELDEESNNFWIGTRKGLSLYKLNTHVITTYLPKPNNVNSLLDEEVRSVHVDKFKRVWVGTKEKGLFLFYPDQERFEKIPLDGFDYVKEIYEDKNGAIWIGSFETAAIAKLTLDETGKIVESKKYTLSIPNSTEKNPYLNFIYEDAKSDIFIGTREGLYKLNPSNNEFENLYIEDKEIRSSLGPHFLSVAQAPDGKYWLGTLGGLLVCDKLEDVRTGNYKRYYSILSDNRSLVDNLIYALFFDASGVLWIGTEDGLDKYDPYENQFVLNKDISKYIGNQAPRIRGFSKTYDGRLIVQTRNNGLFISDNDDFLPLYDNQKDIASIYSEDGRTFYCGLWNGNVMVYDYIKNQSKEIRTGFESVPIFAFCRIDAQRMIIGSFGDGAILVDTQTLQVKDAKSRLLPNYQIGAIENDGMGNAWFATETGVVKYHIASDTIETFNPFSEAEIEVPEDNNVSDIVVDSKGKIWASTPNGLSYYDSSINNFTILTEPKEIYGKWITDILTDANGNLWLNINNNSVAKLDSNLKDVNVYHVDSGNRLDFFSSSGFYEFNNSTIYLGSKNGIISFSSQKMTKNEWSPLPVITEFKIQNEIVLPGRSINGQVTLEKDINYSKKVALDYENRNFSFQFSAPSFTNQQLNKFQYRLKGFDENWIVTDSYSRSVQYTNLYPKDYIFEIRSSNSDGIWSDTTSYNIEILPPFWLTLEFFIGVLILLAITFYFTRREIKNRIKLKQELLTEKVNRVHDIKLNTEKLRLFTNISHELRTPLTLILGPAKQLIDDTGTKATAYQKSRYHLIYQNSNRLLNLVNQVLDFRKAESGTLKLKVSKTDILSYSKNIFESFNEMAINKKIKFNFVVEEDILTGYIDHDKFDKILYNLLSNALKFTDTYGTIDLFLRLKNSAKDILIIEVSDDGIGIPLKSQEKIFHRFFQATNSLENNTGTGIGLSLVKSLVELHKGAIRVESDVNKGSIFEVEIPIARHFYSDEEVFEYTLQDESLQSAVIKDKPAKKLIQNTEAKQKVLVVEDNTELRKFLVDYLSDYYKVYDAGNGEEGLRVCRQIKPVLCVVDVMMPIMDGHEFCSMLKKDEFISHIPVVLLTALSENEDKVKGYGLGADGYLVKPFDPSLLKTIIENIIKSRLELKSKFSGEVESEISLLTHSPIDSAFMENVTSLIHDNLSESHLSTEFLCGELGMSSSKLYRKIKELTDLAPNEFIRTIRLKKSAKLLKTKKYNVSEVTNLVGFNDPFYFSRCFKKQFGFPPSKLIT